MGAERARRMGAERARTQTGFSRAEFYLGLVVINRNFLRPRASVAVYQSGFDAGAKRQRAQFERRVAFAAGSRAGRNAGCAVVVAIDRRWFVRAHSIELAAR